MTSVSSESTSPVLQCPGCRSRLQVGREVPAFEEKCPVCRREVRVTIFPRLFREFVRPNNGTPAAEGEAACTFFPELSAETVCDECGCFMSAKAAVSWGGREICLPCLHRLREVEKDPAYLGRARLQDKRALALVTWLAPFSLFTAPLAIYLLLRYRGEPEGFVPRGRGIWWIAFILSVAWLITWCVFIIVWISLLLEGFS